jgi:hypothetical protein
MKISKSDKSPDSKIENKDHAQSQEPNIHKRAVDNAVYERRAKEFQAMNNPMTQNEFELSLTNNEALRRWDNKKDYIEGIQGVDGGKFPSCRNKY